MNARQSHPALGGLASNPFAATDQISKSHISYVRFVKISRAAELTGYSEDAIRTKIRDGIWPEDLVWKWGPDSVQLVDLEGYDRWAQMRGKASQRGRRKVT
jgi:predicted HNH restriction endonuclease